MDYLQRNREVGEDILWLDLINFRALLEHLEDLSMPKFAAP